MKTTLANWKTENAKLNTDALLEMDGFTELSPAIQELLKSQAKLITAEGDAKASTIKVIVEYTKAGVKAKEIAKRFMKDMKDASLWPRIPNSEGKELKDANTTEARKWSVGRAYNAIHANVNLHLEIGKDGLVVLKDGSTVQKVKESSNGGTGGGDSTEQTEEQKQQAKEIAEKRDHMAKQLDNINSARIAIQKEMEMLRGVLGNKRATKEKIMAAATAALEHFEAEANKMESDINDLADNLKFKSKGGKIIAA